MQSSIYFAIVFVAVTAAEQINVGPQVFSGPQSSWSLSSSSQSPDKRYVTQEYTLYLTPDEIKALQRIESVETDKNTQYPKEGRSEQQNDENEQQLKWYNSQFLPEAPKLEIRGLATHDFYDQKRQSDSEIQQGNNNYNNNLYSSLVEGKPKEQIKEIQRLPTISKENLENYFNWQKEQNNREEVKAQQASDLQSDAKQKSYLTPVATKQDDNQLNEQLKQQWNRILDHNRVQLNSYSPVSKESPQLKQNEKSAEQWNSNYEIEKEIENILRDNRIYEKQTETNGNIQTGAINQRLPILIHKEVSVTKHLPVPWVKKVKVPVPTPVLVPVPEPYEVKIPHPYPVPQHIFKHIPLPVIRNQ